MCNILDKYPEDTFTGYKIAYKKNGKYYSITSHIEYKRGPVSGVKDIEALNGVEDSTLLDSIFFLKEYFGRTSVFRNYGDFIEFFDDVQRCNPKQKIIWLKVTLSGKLRFGSVTKSAKENWPLYFKECVSGTNIDSIEEWKP